MLVGGELGNLAAYGFAPASIVTPLGAVGVLVNCIITTWLLKEAMRLVNYVGILAVIGGIVTIVVCAPQSHIDIRSDTVTISRTSPHYSFCRSLAVARVFMQANWPHALRFPRLSTLGECPEANRN
jgi:hypothetical protein